MSPSARTWRPGTEASPCRAARGEAALEVADLRAHRERGGGRGAGVQQSVAAKQLQLNRRVALRRAQHECHTRWYIDDTLAAGHRHHISLRQAETQYVARTDHTLPIRGKGIVDIEHGDAIARQRREQFALATRDAVEAAEAFEVRAARIGDDAGRGSSNVRDVGDLAQVIRAYLDHHVTVTLIESEQRERHAEIVVEIAFRHQDLATLAQDRGDHLFHRGLAVAARDADHGQVEPRAPRG